MENKQHEISEADNAPVEQNNANAEPNPSATKALPATNYMVAKMAEISLRVEQEDQRREQQRAEAFKLLVDTDNFSPTFADFEEEIAANYPLRSGAEYLKFLREQKKRYANAAHFYFTWSRSKADEFKADAYAHILGHISAELACKLIAVPPSAIEPNLNMQTQSERNANASKNDALTNAAAESRTVDPLSLLKPSFVKWFEEVEKKVMPKGKKINKIRCAAFLELMLKRGAFRETDTNRKTLCDFASGRYGMDITVQLTTGKNEERATHMSQLGKFL
jgi:hypothetical protein